MNKKNDTTVFINGKSYNIAGYEDVDYLQKIAMYLNKKYDELKNSLGYNIVSESDKNILMQMNIADDYLKLKAIQEESSNDADGREKEIQSLKRDIVALSTKLENEELENTTLKKENFDLQKKVIRLEAELSVQTDNNRNLNKKNKS